MSTPSIFDFIVDQEGHKIKVRRSFEAHIDMVWSAFTDTEILDKWWAPKPYKVITKSQEFEVGGRWLYCMKGPEGDEQWCLFDYEFILPFEGFKGQDAFCNEDGDKNETKPIAYWDYRFTDSGESTTVDININFDDLTSLESIIEMGFREGFGMAMGNLDDYFMSQGR